MPLFEIAIVINHVNPKNVVILFTLYIKLKASMMEKHLVVERVILSEEVKEIPLLLKLKTNLMLQM